MINRTMMQYFEWYLPENALHWKRAAAQAAALRASSAVHSHADTTKNTAS